MSTDQVRTTRHLPGQGQGKSRHSVEAATLIEARSSTVWDIITDARNYTVWESGITHIKGELRHGGRIRIRTHTGGHRTFRLHVQQMPGEVMTWTRACPWACSPGCAPSRLNPWAA